MEKLIGLDFGGSSIKYAVMNKDPEKAFLESGQVLNTFSDQAEFLAAVFGIIEDPKSRHQVSGIAISYCGELDHIQGIIHSPGTYAYNGGLNLKKILEDRFGLPVSVENDGNAAMLAEWKLGVLKGYENAAMIVLGTGIGGSFIIDGKLHTGKQGFSGMLSFCSADISKPLSPDHMAMSYAANRYLLREYLIRSGCAECADLTTEVPTIHGTPFTGKDFFEKVSSADPVAEEVLHDYAANVVRLLLNLHCVLEIEAFAIGGGISAQDVLIESLRKEMDHYFEGGPGNALRWPKPEIVQAGFGSAANLIGAALWFRETYGCR